MKKWFITFCALGLISTQAQAADAASNQEEAQAKAIKHEVRVVNIKQYEDILSQFKNELSFTNDYSLKEVSNKLQISKASLDKLITAHLREWKVSIEKQSIETPVKNESTNEHEVQEGEKVENSETVPQEVSKEKEAGKPQFQAPTTEQPTTSKPAEQVKETTNPVTPEAEADSASAFETEVVGLTNAERAKYGLAPLKIYDPLMKVARAKSQDMATNKYFSHTSPTYGSPFDQIKAAGISYSAAGENIAQGQRTAQEVVQAWMNSEGHRANILNGSFTHIGVGYIKNGNYWTQQFIQL